MFGGARVRVGGRSGTLGGGWGKGGGLGDGGSPRRATLTLAARAHALQVRDFEFDPSSGSVYRLVMDNLGVPNVPESLLRAWAVPVSQVARADAYGDIYLRGGAERLANTTSYGWLGGGAPWEAGAASPLAAALANNARAGPQQSEYTYAAALDYDEDGGYAAPTPAPFAQPQRPEGGAIAQRRSRRRRAAAAGGSGVENGAGGAGGVPPAAASRAMSDWIETQPGPAGGPEMQMAAPRVRGGARRRAQAPPGQAAGRRRGATGSPTQARPPLR